MENFFFDREISFGNIDFSKHGLPNIASLWLSVEPPVNQKPY